MSDLDPNSGAKSTAMGSYKRFNIDVRFRPKVRGKDHILTARYSDLQDIMMYLMI